MTSLATARAVAIAGRLSPTDLTVERGSMVAVIGPNGGGKTSLLRAIARVEQASGQVRIDGEDVDALSEARRARLLAFLPASREMAWPISARDIIALGLGARDEQRIDELILLFELGALAQRPINRLSTGERTRVLLARAFASSPRLLLLDEPLSNLEPYWVLRLFEILRAFTDQGGIVLVALHDLARLDRFDRALLIAQGRVLQDETPAKLVASTAFEEIFRLRAAPGGWAIRR